MSPLLKEIRHNPLLWLLAFVPAASGSLWSVYAFLAAIGFVIELIDSRFRWRLLGFAFGVAATVAMIVDLRGATRQELRLQEIRIKAKAKDVEPPRSAEPPAAGAPEQR
jgi:hypothetical protein